MFFNRKELQEMTNPAALLLGLLTMIKSAGAQNTTESTTSTATHPTTTSMVTTTSDTMHQPSHVAQMNFNSVAVAILGLAVIALVVDRVRQCCRRPGADQAPLFSTKV